MELNPYDPPRPAPMASEQPVDVVRGPFMLAFEWTAVLLFNLIVPTLFAWSMTNNDAKLGALIAVLVVAAAGYYFCFQKPLPILIAIRGGILVALTQVFPILHIVCGSLALQAWILLGDMRKSSFQEMLSSIPAGFLVTLMTGLLLIASSFVVGMLMRWVTPAQWWIVKAREFEKDESN
jgi:hypothetical protein